MRQVLRITDYGRQSTENIGKALGEEGGGVTGSSRSGAMHRGDRLVAVIVTSLSVIIERDGTQQRFSLGPFSRGHEAHPRLRAGDTLVVVTETRTNGHTEVEVPECGCRAMIWQD
jgi:hypothetical protein